MPTGTIIPPIWFREDGSDGLPLAAGRLYTFAAGTSTPLTTYKDAALLVPNTNPIILDANGRCRLFLTAVAHRFKLTDANGVVIYDEPTVLALQGVGTSSGLDAPATGGQDLAANELVYGSTAAGGLTAGRWYKADADLAYASTDVELGFATAAILTGAAGYVRRGGVLDGFVGLTPGSFYYASATAGEITATAPSQARVVGFALTATSLLIGFAPSRPDVIGSLMREGRLTLTSGLAVTTVDVTAAGTIYFTPHHGNRIALWTGSRWVVRTFSEFSIAASVTTSKMHDLFVYDNNGVPALEAVAWTNDTTRATALALQNGVPVKSGDATRRYVGTYRTTAVASQTEDSFANRLLWNLDSKEGRPFHALEGTDSWTYTTNVFRQANAAAGNQCGVVVGLASPIVVEAHSIVSNTNAAVRVDTMIGEDSTSVPTSQQIGGSAFTPAANTRIHLTATLRKFAAAGYHTYVWLEGSEATGTSTWYGDAGAGTNYQAGIQGSIQG